MNPFPLNYTPENMISVRNPWRNAWTIRVIAVVDIAFACLLVAIYLQIFLAPVPQEIMDVAHAQPRPSSSLKLLLLGPIIFNSFQIVMSFNLFAASKRETLPVISYAKATTWFQFSTVMLIFLFVKLFLILWFPPLGSLSRREVFSATMAVLESVFKIFGLFLVREFVDDLKCALSFYSSPQFYCIYTQPPVDQDPFSSTTNNVGSASDFNSPGTYVSDSTTTASSDNQNGQRPMSPPQIEPPPEITGTVPKRHSDIVAVV